MCLCSGVKEDSAKKADGVGGKLYHGVDRSGYDTVDWGCAFDPIWKIMRLITSEANEGWWEVNDVSAAKLQLRRIALHFA